ncbi:insulinase family protein [Streptomyces sp. NPDC004435]|uniref:insulinase family protein n=1 Tax=Streptomyces sp. NPDC004435 TaxID=3364701 RepID=UPI00369E4155
MHRDLIDGVPVLWAEAPGPLEAALVFGCGVSDETFRTLGVTHLVEHLAMSTLPRLHYDHNASVTLSLTEFTVSGRPEQVADFLGRVCEALSSLPLDRIEREAGVLAAEGSGATDPTSAELLSFRYGTQGAGLASWDGPGPDRIPVEAVRDTATRYFHSGNAVLVLTGPPPAGLRLPLPAGERPDRGTAQPVLQPGPLWFQAEVPGPGLALRGDLDDPALILAHAVLLERLRKLVRHQEGLTYEIDGSRRYAGPGEDDFFVRLDAREGQERRVAELLWQESLRLADEGVTEAELAEELAALREVWLDPRATSAELGEAAASSLFGVEYQDAQARLNALAKTTPEQARQAFAAALGTALLVVPGETEVELRQPDGTALPSGSCRSEREWPSQGLVCKPSLSDRLLSSAARRARLAVTAEGVWIRDGDGEVIHVPFDEVVGVETDGPGRVVFGRRNCVVPMVPDLFANLGPAVAALDAAVPEALRYPVSGLRVTN